MTSPLLKSLPIGKSDGAKERPIGTAPVAREYPSLSIPGLRAYDHVVRGVQGLASIVKYLVN